VPKSPKPPSKLDQLRALRAAQTERREVPSTAPVRKATTAPSESQGASRTELLPIRAKRGPAAHLGRASKAAIAARKPSEARGSGGVNGAIELPRRQQQHPIRALDAQFET
jgi:hypothetical protein